MSSKQSSTRIAAASLFAAWLVHDIEEALTFPATSGMLAERMGTQRLLVTPSQSKLAIALMGVLVGAACVRGARTHGKSRLYRSVAAGLEAHVATHIAASIAFRGYTAGLITAPLVMLPGARLARAEIRHSGSPLLPSDTMRGGALLFGAALASHLVSRFLLRSRNSQWRLSRCKQRPLRR
ncbi:HXXEE domain-containing protein [Cryobacterium fucosi]|uniref:HXXEE domain-containing protein n=1 Tax=Cryobacterium fucosi TaxID=1259157 RepID=A0A4R9BG50_9MICO|nr:HXXEE domain-containing protein [Cryobacterium fucosi]TFD81982.1 HXXEE domain-containing protein [Cryobacterium fucosi]